MVRGEFAEDPQECLWRVCGRVRGGSGGESGLGERPRTFRGGSTERLELHGVDRELPGGPPEIGGAKGSLTYTQRKLWLLGSYTESFDDFQEHARNNLEYVEQMLQRVLDPLLAAASLGWMKSEDFTSQVLLE